MSENMQDYLLQPCESCNQSMEFEYLDPMGLECDECYTSNESAVSWAVDEELDYLDIGGEG